MHVRICMHMCEHVPLSTSTYSAGIDVRTRPWVICCRTKYLQASKALNNPLPLEIIRPAELRVDFEYLNERHTT